MSQNLKNKVALVTVASRSLGAAIAKRLASDGAAVAITFASPEAAYITGASLLIDCGYTA